MELDPQPFRIEPLLRDVSVILAANAEGKPVELRFDIDPALPATLVGDALRLQQVLVNLGGNAIKFTPEGEVLLAVTVLAREAAQATIEFSVRDTGIGIAPENQARIFSGFTQAEASTTRRFGGTGLGVAISQRLVALMGGELRVASALGAGSRFWFRAAFAIPTDEATEAGAPVTVPDALALTEPGDRSSPTNVPRAGAASARLAGLRLLVAEDNANNQQVALELLGDEGAKVEIAVDGAAAVAAVARADPPYDAVLMDIQMPVVDGYTAASRIRHELGRRDLPIIAMTANAMASDRAACLAAGMNDHVPKPFDFERLVAVIGRLTGRSNAPAAVAAPARRPPMPPMPPEAPEAVDTAAALARLGGRHDVYRRLLGNLLVDLHHAPAELRALAEGGRAEELRSRCHTLKGLAGTLGASALASAAAQAERAFAAAPAAAAADEALGALLEAIGFAAAALRAVDAALDGAEPTGLAGPQAASGIDETLAALRDRLASADMDALALLDRLRAAHAEVLGEHLAPLDAAVAALDFERALALCEGLLEACRA